MYTLHTINLYIECAFLVATTNTSVLFLELKKHSLSHPSEACIVKLVTFNQRKTPFNVLFMSWENFISTERP